ncbi:MAG: enoyl-CoA hydratase/isomerase family protein, partial [Nevskia sp.]|nr:enoyl-CoA hydratase/isomerase family protein [Nevskia sp.]
MSSVDYRLEGDIAVLIVNNPPVNALSMAVRIALLDLVKKTDADSAVKAVVLIGAGKTFVAGADIREFGKKLEGPSGRSSMEAIEASNKPFVAALHGTALGGGLELALTAHYRVALPGAKLGLPEALIGVLPGAGGTQRLPRLVGVETALDLITSGKHIDGKKALQYGIVDELVEGQDFDALLKGALAYARKVVAENRPLKRVRDLNDKISGIDPAVFTKYREANAKKWKGLVSQWKIVDLIEAACTRPWDEAYALEDKAFHEVKESPERAALSHVFFAEREAARIPDVPAEIKPAPVKSVAIIGAGTMGGGIAMAFANSGIPVKQVEVSQEALDRGRAIVRKNYDTSVSRGSMAQASADEAFGRISGATDYA